MENITSQREELVALHSIYDASDLIIEQENPIRGRFLATVQLPKPFYIECKRLTIQDSVRFEVEYLPPIILRFEFIPTYPSLTCPAFSLTCNWLDKKRCSELSRKLESIWKESYGEVILFTWISFLQEETLSFLNIGNSLNVCELCSFNGVYNVKSNVVHFVTVDLGHEFTKLSVDCDGSKSNVYSSEDIKDVSNTDVGIEMNCNQEKSVLASSTTEGIHHVGCCAACSDEFSEPNLLSILKEYNSNKKQEAFKNTWITCQICYTTKKGADFHTFNNCAHNFCSKCLKSYFEIQIKEGNVYSLNCPEEGCSSEADGTLVKSLVGKELFERYDNILLSRTLEGMTDIAYCPRQGCQTPLLTDSGSRIGTCPLCSYSFCMFCQRAYHGIAPCNFRAEEKKELCKKYLQSSTQEKIDLERRYGKRELKFLVENVKSEEWVESNSKQCPHCHANIEKTDGCNKMTCHRCGKYFCWLCLTLLRSSNPYSHFSDFSSNCYNQLFPENYDYVMPGEYLDL